MPETFSDGREEIASVTVSPGGRERRGFLPETQRRQAGVSKASVLRRRQRDGRFLEVRKRVFSDRTWWRPGCHPSGRDSEQRRVAKRSDRRRPMSGTLGLATWPTRSDRAWAMNQGNSGSWPSNWHCICRTSPIVSTASRLFRPAYGTFGLTVRYRLAVNQMKPATMVTGPCRTVNRLFPTLVDNGPTVCDARVCSSTRDLWSEQRGGADAAKAPSRWLRCAFQKHAYGAEHPTEFRRAYGLYSWRHEPRTGWRERVATRGIQKNALARIERYCASQRGAAVPGRTSYSKSWRTGTKI